jgi:hypothetical protein
MTKFAPLAVLATLAAFSLAPAAAYADALVTGTAHVEGAAPFKISEGKMIYGANGQRLAPVYRVNTDGSVQLIMEGRLVTIAAGILSDVNGKLTSSQTKSELLR